MATSDKSRAALKAHFDSVQAEMDEIRAKTDPLRKKRDELLAKIQPVEDEARELAEQIMKLEQPRLAELSMELSSLAAVLPGNRKMSEGEPQPEE